MFWKKEPPRIYVEIPSEETRCAFRVEPRSHTPIALLVAGEPARIRNISTSGIAFDLENGCEPVFDTGQTIEAVLFLEGNKRHPVPVELTLVEHYGSFYRCQMCMHSHQAEKAIGRYIIEHQKREIRNASAAAENPPHTSD